MPRYSFSAKLQNGETYSGTREAKDEYDLAKTLRQEGYILISAAAEKAKKSFSFYFSLLNQVSSREKMIFTRNLRVMIGAGVSLNRALNTLSRQTKNNKLKNALLVMESEITKGKSFSDALLQYPDIFSPLFRSMISVGEESGTLEKNLTILAKQMEREQELTSKIQSAMIYPIVIILTMIGIGAMMLVVVVPKLSQIFEDLQIKLPLTTKLVILLGNFLAQKWYFVIVGLIISFILFRAALRTKTGKKLASSLSFKMPIIAALVQKTNSAHIVRTLSSLITAGVPLVRSLEIIAETLTNFDYQKTILGAVEEVKKGKKLSEALKPYPHLYSLTVIQMVEVGEETGETSDVLEKLGDFFDEEITMATKNLVAVIEPVLMLIIGGVVGFFAISMVQPMYSMLSGLK
ncbi:MAG: type II secretion system F family protein [Candidatus Nealsonbacteria bacterium]|nr:type II secretion system F family protein [Candidatus Nealsonbacteria bacterium]